MALVCEGCKSDTYYIIQFLDVAPMALINHRINEYQGYRPSLLYVARTGLANHTHTPDINC